MKRLIIIVSLLFILLNPFVAMADVSEVNLIKQLNHVAIGDTMRLNILQQLIDITKSKPKERAGYIDKMLKEAESQNNNKYKCKAYLLYIATAYNMYDAESINKWYKLLEPLAMKEKLYDIMFQGKQSVIDIMLLKDEYELQEKEAKKMLALAYELNNKTGIILAYKSLALVYKVTYRKQKAVEMLEKTYTIATEGNFHSLALEVNYSLIGSYKEFRDKEKWLKSIKIRERYINNLLKRKPYMASSLRNSMLSTYICYLIYYVDSNDLVLAEKYFDKVTVYYNGSNDNPKIYKQIYHNARMNYFTAKSRYNDAIVEIDSLLYLWKDVSTLSYYDYMAYKSLILYNAGRYKESIDLYKRTTASEDSMHIALINLQSKQLKKDYKADLMTLENAQINKNRQILILVIISIIIIAFVVFIVCNYKIKRKLSRSKREMNKMTNDMKMANDAKELFLSNISTVIRAPLNIVVETSLQLCGEKDIDIEEKKKKSEIINKTSVELMNLINNILDLSSLEAGMMKFTMCEVNSIMTIKDSLQSLVINKLCNTRATYNVDPSIQYIISIDTSKFLQILTNLLVDNVSDISTLYVNIENENELTFTVSGSNLALPNPTQEITISNEINRMIIEHFGGNYKIFRYKKPGYIKFFIPIKRIHTSDV